MKKLLQELLVEKKIAGSIKEAQALIMSGNVIINDHRIDKPSTKVSLDSTIRIRGKSHNYVSRGGLKLEHAIKTWGGPIKNSICLDVGASTGGFTEVLLNHGAKKVYAVDVGYGQLAEILRNDSRVVSLERTHILDLSKTTFETQPSIAVIDVSFISLERILAHIVNLLAKNARIFALIKPQFEVDKKYLNLGIVKDEKIRNLAVEKIINLAKDLKLNILGVEKSPILGAKGNVEFLLALEKL